MHKDLSESKRSVHSTRIDTIAGDITPIKPVDTLPINAIQRPKVEDPEYYPDTVSELAASLSALARLVPPNEVQEIYVAIRDLIERLRPITQTSLSELDGLTEVTDAERKARRAAEEEAQSASFERQRVEADAKILLDKVKGKVDQIRRRMDVLRVERPEGYERIVSDISRYSAKLEKIADDLVKIYRSPSTPQSERKKIEDYINKQIAAYNDRRAIQSDLSPERFGSIGLDERNFEQIVAAFDAQIERLRATGDAYDLEISEMIADRLELIGKLFGENASAEVERVVGASTPARPDVGDPGDSSDDSLAPVTRKIQVQSTPLSSVLPLITSSTSPTGGQSGGRTPGGRTFDRLSSFTVRIAARHNRQLLPRSPSTIVDPDRVDLFIMPVFRPGDVRFEVVTEEKGDRRPDSVRIVKRLSRHVGDLKNIHIVRRFVQMFDGTEIEIQPDVVINIDAIRDRFVEQAKDDMIAGGLSKAKAEEKAQEFFEKHKVHVVREELGDGSCCEAHRLALDKLDQLISTGDGVTFKDERLSRVSPDWRVKSASERRAEDELRTYSQLEQRNEVSATINQIVNELFDEPGSRLQSIGSGLGMEAKDSFDAITRVDRKKMRARGIHMPETLPVSQDQVEEGSEEIARIIERVVPALPEGEVASADFLVDSLNRLVESRLEAAVAGLRTAERKRGAKLEEDQRYIGITQAVEQLRGYLAELRRVSVSTRRVSPNFDLTSYEGILSAYALISQFYPNSSEDPSFAMSATGLREEATDATSAAISQILREAKTPRGASVLSADDNDAPRIASSIASIVAELRGVSGDLVGSRLLGAAFEHFKITPDRQDLPIFADQQIKDALQEFFSEIGDEAPPRFLEDGRWQTISPQTADALYNLSPGTCQTAISHLHDLPAATIESQITSVSELFARGAAKSYSTMLAESSRGDPAINVLRSFVLIAARVVMRERQSRDTSSQSSEGQSLLRLTEAIESVLRVGRETTKIDTAMYLNVPVETYAVSVDPTRFETGYFTDIVGYPVARVVALHETLPDGSYTLEFLDSKLKRAFDKAHAEAISQVRLRYPDIASHVDSSKPGDDKRSLDIVRGAVTRNLTRFMQRSAAQHNMAFRTLSAEERVFRAGSSDRDTVAQFIEEQESKAKRGPSRFARSLAAMAANQAKFEGRVPQQIRFFTPVRDTDKVDPDTGHYILNDNDYVVRTVDVYCADPRIPAYAGQLEDPRTKRSFLDQINQTVSDHVLRAFFDPFGFARSRAVPAPDKVEQELKKGKGKFMLSAYDYVFKSLWSQQGMDPIDPAKGGLTTAQRRPYVINGVPVLVDGPVVAETGEGEGGSGYRSVKEYMNEAEDFIISLMKKTTGYGTVAGQRFEMNESGSAVLDSVLDYVRTQVAKGLMSPMIMSNNKLTTLLELKDAERRKSREAMIARIASDPELVGADHAFTLRYDPQTGMPILPKSPKVFFREKGITRSLSADDPIKFITMIASAHQDYVDMVRREFGGNAQELTGMFKAIEILKTRMPSVWKKVQDRAAEMLAEEERRRNLEDSSLQPIATPSIELTPDNKILGIEPGEDPASYLQGICIIVVRGCDYLARFAAGSPSKMNLTGQLNQLAISGNRISQRLGAKRKSITLDLFGEIREIRSLLDTFSALQSDVVSFVANRRRKDTGDMLESALEKVCSERLEELKTAGTRESPEIQALTDALNAVRSVSNFATPSERDGEKTEFKTPPITDKVEESLDILENFHSDIVQKIFAARSRASRIETMIANRIDQKIISIANAVAPKIVAYTGQKIKAGKIMIFDTVAEMQSFRSQVASSYAQILKAGAEIEEGSDEEADLNQQIDEYSSGVLSSMLFGVRNDSTDTARDSIKTRQAVDRLSAVKSGRYIVKKPKQLSPGRRVK